MLMVFKKSAVTAYILIFMACALFAVSTGCGKKGPPRPPVDNTAPEK